MKYGRYGFPKQKHVYFDGKALRWRAGTKHGNNKKKRIILVDSQGHAADVEIQAGYRDPKSVFKRFKVMQEFELLSFRIIQKLKNGKNGRDLCLQAANKEEMERFVNNIEIVLADLRQKQIEAEKEEQKKE